MGPEPFPSPARLALADAFRAFSSAVRLALDKHLSEHPEQRIAIKEELIEHAATLALATFNFTQEGQP